MATKGSRRLSSLLGEDDSLDNVLDNKKPPPRNGPNRSLPANCFSAADNIFSMLAEEGKQDGADSESSDVSAADPSDILRNIKDMDDMDDDLFAPKKKQSSVSAQTKQSGKDGPTKSAAVVENDERAGGERDKPIKDQNKPNRVPSSEPQNYEGFNFSDFEDNLDDFLPDETKQNGKDKFVPSSPVSLLLKKKGPAATMKHLDFNHDKGGVKDDLGFDSDQNGTKKKDALLLSEEGSDPPQRPRTKVSEIMESLSAPNPLERRDSGEKKEQPLEKTTPPKSNPGYKQNEDLAFGSYQPSVVSVPEGRQSRRQSVRFSTEDMSTLEKKVKPSTPTRRRGSADWLGLKTKDVSDLQLDAAESETVMASSNPPAGRRASVSGYSTAPAKSTVDPPSAADNDLVKAATTEVSVSQKQNEEDDWLSRALSRKSVPSASRPEAAPQMSAREETSGSTERADLDRKINKPASSQAPRIRDDDIVADGEISGTSRSESGPAALSTPIRESTIKRDRTTTNSQNTSAPLQEPQINFSAESLQVLLQQQVLQPPLPGLGAPVPSGAQQDHQSWLARIIQLEGQIKTLQLERDHSQLLLENIQLRHKQEMDLIENAHKKSMLEMKKCYEDQIQRLKRLKDEEIDAVTSAASQTGSLSGVIEQMEQFSSRLGELSSRVESTHENTAHTLEQGARHGDEQLRIVQDCLAKQQKAMAEEKAHLEEIISRMDTQVNEQQRQLEKERWKATAEQAKAESTQKALEEQRRSLSVHMNMEREELERAKSALLEEQKSVMQQCAEERRKLAAEWASLHTQEKQRHNRAEREVSSLLEREGAIISLAQEQADMKLCTAELKQKKLAIAEERENLDRLREELDREKERVNATALRLETRVQEVEALSKLAAEKFDEGERALHAAKLVETKHEAGLRQIHCQTEKLRREQQLLQDKMQHNLQKEQHGHFITFPQVPTPVPPDLTQLEPTLKPATTLSPVPDPSANFKRMAFQASLALWKYTAAKDREYLEDEKIYLDNLKKKSYKLNFIA